MNQANVEKVVSRLRYNVGSKPRRFRNPEGPEGRLRKIRKTLTGLMKYERIELNYPRADETRGYVDRVCVTEPVGVLSINSTPGHSIFNFPQLISEALRHGPEHKETMELANFWILEKQLVHKLFKVLVPRYQNYTTSFTKLHNAPCIYPGYPYKRAVLELKGNVYPRIEQHNPHQHTLLHNILLDAAGKEYRIEKYKEIAENMNS